MEESSEPTVYGNEPNLSLQPIGSYASESNPVNQPISSSVNETNSFQPIRLLNAQLDPSSEPITFSTVSQREEIAQIYVFFI